VFEVKAQFIQKPSAVSTRLAVVVVLVVATVDFVRRKVSDLKVSLYCPFLCVENKITFFKVKTLSKWSHLRVLPTPFT
jgi:hypothetical protein